MKKRFCLLVIGMVLSLVVKETFAYQQKIKSGKLSQSYTKIVLCEISKSEMARMWRNEGAPFDREVQEDQGRQSVVKFQVDGKENIYVLFYKTVNVFEKNSKSVRKINLFKGNFDDSMMNSIYVDKDGSFCVYNQENRDSKPYVYLSSNGYSAPIITQPGAYLRFLNGVLYSEHGGGILYSANKETRVEQKTFYRDFHHGTKKHGEAIYKNKLGEESALPTEIDDFHLMKIMAIDLAGNIYVEAQNGDYVEGTKGELVLTHSYFIYKFDPNSRLLARIPLQDSLLLNGFVDLESESVYEVEATDTSYRFVKWLKSKN